MSDSACVCQLRLHYSTWLPCCSTQCSSGSYARPARVVQPAKSLSADATCNLSPADGRSSTSVDKRLCGVAKHGAVCPGMCLPLPLGSCCALRQCARAQLNVELHLMYCRSQTLRSSAHEGCTRGVFKGLRGSTAVHELSYPICAPLWPAGTHAAVFWGLHSLLLHSEQSITAMPV